MPSVFTVLPNIKWQVGAQGSLTASTATQLQATSPTVLARQGIQVQAPATNTASIWVGTSNVTNAQGIEIQPGGSETIPMADPSQVYAYATASGQKYNYSWI